MPYKRLITISVFVLLILAFITGLFLWQKQKSAKPEANLAGKVHPEFYLGALKMWNATLQTGPFRGGSSSAIRLTWEKPTDIYNHFLITLTDPQTGWTRTESGEHDRVSLDLTDLEPNTSYAFVLRACLNPNCEDWIVSDKEAVDSTQQMAWQVIPETDKFAETLEHDWKFKTDLAGVVLQHQDNTPFSDEEKSALVLEQITLSKNRADYQMILKDSTGAFIYAQLINP